VFSSAINCPSASCAKIRTDLYTTGILIGPYDLQIAAQALRRKLILVTLRA